MRLYLNRIEKLPSKQCVEGSSPSSRTSFFVYRLYYEIVSFFYLLINKKGRLRSGTNNEYFNSFGSGSSKIGSAGVVTVNFPRLAMKSENREDFLKKVADYFDITARINNAKRNIIKRRIEDNAAPLYTLGFMDINKQYSTLTLRVD